MTTERATPATRAATPWQRIRGSIHLRLLASLLAMILLGTGILAATAYQRALDNADALLDGQMRLLARAIATGLPLNVDPEAPSSIAELRNTDYVVQVWSIDGQRVYSSQPRILMPDRAVFGFSDWSEGKGTWRMYAVQAGARVIQVAQNLDERERLAGDLAWQTVLPILLWMPILLAGSGWVVSRSLRPLTRVRAQLAQREADDLSPVSDVGVPQEVRPVVAEVNLLLDRLRSAFEAQRHFVADAAHELRTPLTALKLQLQHLERTDSRHAGSAPDADRLVAMARLRAGIDRASRLVEQLLALAREEAAGRKDGNKTNLVTLDLARVAGEVIGELSPLAESRGLDLGLVSTTPSPLTAEPDALRILIRNLVDNAIKHTPSGGTVDVAAMPDADGALLVVEDSGPGIAPADRAKVFDRFHRLEIRADTDAEGASVTGSGLGLAIVQAIANRHAADIRLESSARLGGLRVAVRFPPGRPLGR